MDTDILLDHLTRADVRDKRAEPSVLRQAMSQFFCYTTVFNAIELFSLCRSVHERKAVEDVMHSMKILGLNGKSAKRVGMYFARSAAQPLRAMEVLIAGICLESRLPILTGSPRRYAGMRALRVITVKEIQSSHRKGSLWS